MHAWNPWFESVKDKTVKNGGFHGGAREISKDGSRELTMGLDSISGYSIIHTEDIDEAKQIAQGNPYIASIRVYEIMGQQPGLS